MCFVVGDTLGDDDADPCCCCDDDGGGGGGMSCPGTDGGDIGVPIFI